MYTISIQIINEFDHFLDFAFECANQQLTTTIDCNDKLVFSDVIGTHEIYLITDADRYAFNFDTSMGCEYVLKVDKDAHVSLIGFNALS